MIWCPNCEDMTQETVVELGEKEYKITETRCSVCKALLVSIKRLMGRLLDKT